MSDADPSCLRWRRQLRLTQREIYGVGEGGGGVGEGIDLNGFAVMAGGEEVGDGLGRQEGVMDKRGRGGGERILDGSGGAVMVGGRVGEMKGQGRMKGTTTGTESRGRGRRGRNLGDADEPRITAATRRDRIRTKSPGVSFYYPL